MRTLSRYIGREVLGSTFLVLMGLIVLFAFFDLIRELGDLSSGYFFRRAVFYVLLGLPTLGAACVHDLVGNLRHTGPSMFQQLGAGPMLLGFAVATVSAAVAVRWLVSFLTRRGLAPFGWYRLALSALLATLFASGLVSLSG